MLVDLDWCYLFNPADIQMGIWPKLMCHISQYVVFCQLSSNYSKSDGIVNVFNSNDIGVINVFYKQGMDTNVLKVQ